MALKELKVTDFRCLESATLPLTSKYTLIFGDNGSGKTSLLEAIYFLSRGRSFRKTRTDRLIRHGHPTFTLFAQVARHEGIQRVGLRAGRGFSEVRIDGQDMPGFAPLAAVLAVEIIDPEIHGLIAEGPDERRRFIDFGVFHVKHDFLDQWRQYRRVLKQRNSALRTGRPWNEIDIWNEELIATGTDIDRARRDYVDKLSTSFSKIAAELVTEGKVTCVYKPGWADNVGFADALARSRDRDREQGTTTVGPHRADLRIDFAGRLARQQVSRGQQKLVAAALTLAQTADIAEQTGDSPVLLLDDPAAELDRRSVAALMEKVAQSRSQVIVTALERSSVSFPETPALFHVEQGVVSAV